MIEQIKKIISNYLNNMKLPVLMQGIKTQEGIYVSDALTIPDELIYVPTWLRPLKEYAKTEKTSVGEHGSHTHEYRQHIELEVGDKVYMLRNLGGQLFFIMDVIKNE